MLLPKKYNIVVINVLLAVVITLVINFSYLLAIREQDRREFGTPPPLPEGERVTPHSGTLRVYPDGYGYILCGDEHCGGMSDSIYVNAWTVRRMNLVSGIELTVTARYPQTEGANKSLWKVLEINGEPFDYGSLYNRPSNNLVLGFQLSFYLLFTFILLSIMTLGAGRNSSVAFFLKRAGICVVLAVGMFFLMPVAKARTGELIIAAVNVHNGSLIVDPVDILKCSFVLVFAILYGRMFQLTYQKEDIMLENEQLKNEYLKARYYTLINQINPHFLFNSLNSLSALVREGNNEDAVTYIDRLSDTFRYTIQNEPHTTTTLRDELEFVNAYKYLLEIRYDEKLFIDIDVEKEKMEWTLPTFSIQPLIENAVKHNSITRAKPLHISIHTEGDYLIVSNPVHPKIGSEKSTGIGLENLSNRWLLLTGKSIEVSNDGKTFSVRLPFINTTP